MAVTVGLVSMVSFVILYFMIEGTNPELGKVMKIDLGAILILVIGFVLYRVGG